MTIKFDDRFSIKHFFTNDDGIVIHFNMFLSTEYVNGMEKKLFSVVCKEVEDEEDGDLLSLDVLTSVHLITMFCKIAKVCSSALQRSQTTTFPVSTSGNFYCRLPPALSLFLNPYPCKIELEYPLGRQIDELEVLVKQVKDIFFFLKNPIGLPLNYVSKKDRETRRIFKKHTDVYDDISNAIKDNEWDNDCQRVLHYLRESYFNNQVTKYLSEFKCHLEIVAFVKQYEETFGKIKNLSDFLNLIKVERVEFEREHWITPLRISYKTYSLFVVEEDHDDDFCVEILKKKAKTLISECNLDESLKKKILNNHCSPIKDWVYSLQETITDDNCIIAEYDKKRCKQIVGVGLFDESSGKVFYLYRQS